MQCNASPVPQEVFHIYRAADVVGFELKNQILITSSTEIHRYIGLPTFWYTDPVNSSAASGWDSEVWWARRENS
jgi:hypothetical protein